MYKSIDRLDSFYLYRRMLKNKAGYTAIQSRTVGQELLCENRSEFNNVMDGPTDLPTDLPTDTARCRVACPRLKRKSREQMYKKGYAGSHMCPTKSPVIKQSNILMTTHLYSHCEQSMQQSPSFGPTGCVHVCLQVIGLHLINASWSINDNHV